MPLRVEVIAATDTNPKYLSCARHYISFWNSLRSSIEGVIYVPRVLLVADKIDEALLPVRDYVTVIEPNDISTSFLAQNSRTLWTGLSRADAVVTSDIDMLPLHTRVMDSGVREFLESPDSFVVMRDVLPPGQYPICYSLAAPQTWREIFQVQNKKEFNFRVHELWSKRGVGATYSGEHGGSGWFTDQEYLFDMISHAELHRGLRVRRLKDSDTGHRRLDRVTWRGWFRWFQILGVLAGRYSDYHVHHPIWKFQRFLRWVWTARTIQAWVSTRMTLP